MLRSLNTITKDAPMTTRSLGWASPNPGLSTQVELSGRDAGGLLNLGWIGKALPGKGITAEEPPPALWAALSQQAPVGKQGNIALGVARGGATGDLLAIAYP